jgi:hypothetical protein
MIGSLEFRREVFIMDDHETTTEAPAEKPKLATNNFRNEVEDARVSDDEMLHRNQVVMHTRLAARKVMFQLDRESSEESLDCLNELIGQFKELPESVMRDMAVEEATKHFDLAVEAIKKIHLSDVDEVVLATLSKVLADREVDRVRHEAAIDADLADFGAGSGEKKEPEPTAADGGPVMDDDENEEDD